MKLNVKTYLQSLRLPLAVDVVVDLFVASFSICVAPVLASVVTVKIYNYCMKYCATDCV